MNNLIPSAPMHREHCIMNDMRERLTAILERYVSRITVVSMLTTVLAHRGVSEHYIHADNLVELVEEVMRGLRLFCAPDRLPDLMIELAEFCDRETLFAHGVPSRRPAALEKVVTS